MGQYFCVLTSTASQTHQSSWHCLVPCKSGCLQVGRYILTQSSLRRLIWVPRRSVTCYHHMRVIGLCGCGYVSQSIWSGLHGVSRTALTTLYLAGPRRPRSYSSPSRKCKTLTTISTSFTPRRKNVHRLSHRAHWRRRVTSSRNVRNWIALS